MEGAGLTYSGGRDDHKIDPMAAFFQQVSHEGDGLHGLAQALHKAKGHSDDGYPGYPGPDALELICI